jgi:hypothetical protein
VSGDRGLAPREPIRVAPALFAARGIRYASQDLFTGVSTTSAGEPVHFGLTRLTSGNLPFWRHYRASTASVADILTRLAKKLEVPEDRVDLEALASEHGWSRGELDRIAEVVRRRAYAAKKVFRSVKGGATGIEWVLDDFFAPTEDRFVAYAAKEPIADGAAPPPYERDSAPAARLRQHRALYSALLLTVGVATERGIPTVTHFGIFRDPLAFLDPGTEHRGLAMQLHGFAATVSLHAFAGKAFMITNPMPRMTEILQRRVAPEDLYAGDSDAGVRRYVNRNLPAGVPPIGERQRFSFAGFTLGAQPTVVKLTALADHYRPAGPAGGETRHDI